jgi:FKBP-type peptidyl-prolyl cis-trans isomerase FkpA
MLKGTSLFLIACHMVLLGCNGCREQQHQVALSEAELRQQLIEHNKSEHQAETQRIKAFVKEKGWPMTETGTGLYCWIYENGNGAAPVNGNVVDISYKVTLLDGTAIYEAQNGQFRLGEDNVESGLHEALLLMHLGDKARLIMPSHLAFGLTGDSEKVPQKATLLYDIALLRIAQ